MRFSHILLVFAVALICVNPISASAGHFDRSTNDPKHQGYTSDRQDHIWRISWEDVEAKCEPCKPVALDYNRAVRSLFELKYQKAMIGYRVWLVEAHIDEIKRFKKEGGTVTGGGEEAVMASALDALFTLDELKKVMAQLDAQIINVNNAVFDLWQQLEQCEKKCQGEEPESLVSLEGGEAGPTLPFDWKGPYPPVCHRCAKLAARLNELPGLAIVEQASLEAAKGQKVALESELAFIRLTDTDIEFVDDKTSVATRDGRILKGKEAEEYLQERDKVYDTKKQERMEKLEAEIRKAEEAIALHEGNLKKIKKNFEETLKLYNDCVPTCNEPVSEEPEQTGAISIPGAETMPVTENAGCSFPSSYPPINIGPNNEVGTGAQLQSDIKKKAKGMAMGGLGSVLGGGINMGGGAGGPIGSPGGDSNAPKTDKDPTSGPFVTVSSGDTDLEIRAGFTGEGLVISTNIDDTPNKGTFHAQWLEGGDGRIYFPTRYLLIDLYRNWKLSVWWTYDRWVNGDHVEHDEGDSMTVGTDYLGRIKIFEGAEGVSNSIWHTMGFETAVKGVQHLGSVFNVPASAFDGGCPMRVVTHISQPKGNPVYTIPVIGELFRSEEKDDKSDLMVFIRPALINTADE